MSNRKSVFLKEESDSDVEDEDEPNEATNKDE